MQSTLGLMAAEAKELRPGGEAVITRLGDILVIQAIRSWIETDPAAQTGWLGALQDRQIGRPISLIHGDPVRAWTGPRSRELAMSRSALAARFTETRRRARDEVRHAMADARRAQLAQEDRATVAELTSRLGYRSEAAFARAFVRVIGVSPGAVKRAQAQTRASAGGVAAGTPVRPVVGWITTSGSAWSTARITAGRSSPSAKTGSAPSPRNGRNLRLRSETKQRPAL